MYVLSLDVRHRRLPMLKKVKGYVGAYVDLNGDVLKRNERGEYKALTPTRHSNGYLYVSLDKHNGKKAGKPTLRKLDELVLITYVGPKPDKNHVVHHLNGNLRDNSVSNLKWLNQTDRVKFLYC